MSDDWSGDILARLKVRDEIDNRDFKYFRAFEQIRRMKTSNNSSKNPDDNERLVERLNAATIEGEKKDSQIQKLTKQVNSLEKTVKLQQNKIEGLMLEVKEKNKNIEIINDEVLMNQILTNVLQKKVDELTSENEQLIKRWMDRVSREVQEMNDANLFLENVRQQE